MTSPHLSIEAMMVCVDPQLESIAQYGVITETNDNNKPSCGN